MKPCTDFWHLAMDTFQSKNRTVNHTVNYAVNPAVIRPAAALFLSLCCLSLVGCGVHKVADEADRPVAAPASGLPFDVSLKKSKPTATTADTTPTSAAKTLSDAPTAPAKSATNPPAVNQVPVNQAIADKTAPAAGTSASAPAANNSAAPAANNSAAPAATDTKANTASPLATTPSPASGAAAPAAETATASPEQRFADALALMKAKQNTDALAAFKALTERAPNYTAPFVNLGILYARTKQRDPAIEAFQHALKLEPNNAIAATWLGSLYREKGDYTQAEQNYLLAVRARPNYAAAHFDLAVLYDQYLQRYAAAIAEYNAYLKLTPDGDIRVQAWIKALEARLNPIAPPATPPAARTVLNATAPSASESAASGNFAHMDARNSLKNSSKGT